MSKKTLVGKRVAIIGGASGIGRETALAFLAAGSWVVIGDPDHGRARAVADQFGRLHGGVIHGLTLDTARAEAFPDFLDAAARKLGGLDAVVNAADAPPAEEFLVESDADTDRQIDVNLRAVIAGTRAAARAFLDQGSGHIVNIGSAAGVTGALGTAVYCATKHAVTGLGAALQDGLAERGVLVSTVAPGYAPGPEPVADAIVACVEQRRGGLVDVGQPGWFATARPAPIHLRRRVRRLFGAA
ncbi:SDR family NAD(P)-dependent oxidoreductase [Nocardia puris]|uniref:Short subunit dehydrogenase n=1 Tax=Nocardia puris TaxID=208602 RepID=A0A366E2C6_9NOCA|nr:SDR family NAD(P)-dependent oxidoreductase [Nocardia puris]RBO96472.1 short subunit dehydrogenase [Nocardia puris]